jgi:hypothetical protein
MWRAQLRGTKYYLALGVARLTQAYDERGNLIEQRLFGIDGKQATTRCAHETWTYDEFGNNGVSECARLLVDDRGEDSGGMPTMEEMMREAIARDDG